MSASPPLLATVTVTLAAGAAESATVNAARPPSSTCGVVLDTTNLGVAVVALTRWSTPVVYPKA